LTATSDSRHYGIAETLRRCHRRHLVSKSLIESSCFFLIPSPSLGYTHLYPPSSSSGNHLMPLSVKSFEKIVGLSAELVTERLSELTPRETEIANLLADGILSRIIAADLGISPKTLDIHRANIQRKIGVKSTANVVRFVLLKRLVDAFSKEEKRQARSN
jgi:DNA-binding CsgD family transcriptional regulator